MAIQWLYRYPLAWSRNLRHLGLPWGSVLRLLNVQSRLWIETASGIFRGQGQELAEPADGLKCGEGRGRLWGKKPRLV